MAISESTFYTTGELISDSDDMYDLVLANISECLQGKFGLDRPTILYVHRMIAVGLNNKYWCLIKQNHDDPFIIDIAIVAKGRGNLSGPQSTLFKWTYVLPNQGDVDRVIREICNLVINYYVPSDHPAFTTIPQKATQSFI